jgi:HAD superfamily hydrolase (TIGR01549 family)
LAVGFLEEDAKRAVATYGKEFGKRYHPPAFEGVDSMLRDLRNQGVRLGIVTSNTRDNVTSVLAESLDAFDHSCLFFYDTDAPPQPKSWCLTEGARRLGLLPANCVYVGDQPADFRAAEEVRFQFLGVTYGWGLLPGDPRFETADTVDEIPQKIVDMDTKRVTR